MTLKNLSIEVDAFPEDFGPEGQFDDPKDLALVKKRMARSVWGWCSVRVRAKWKGLTAVDYLGGCSYKSEEDFIKTSGYYEDMVATVKADLREQALDIANSLDELSP
jgi:hypothetical protein